MSDRRQLHIKEDVKCSCKGYTLDKMLQPNILILLAKKDLHGYSIIRELEKKNLFQGEKADNTGIYRALRTLRDKGMVRSEWDVDGAGAAKKIYNITDLGRVCLKNWIKTLEEYRGTIETMIGDAKAALE